MAGFIRRFTQFPTIEVLSEIEAINIVDLAPPFPTTGIGTGTLYTVGEFEDGPFGEGGDSAFYDSTIGSGNLEAFSSQDFLNKFGGFGFTYANEIHQNPCARKRNQELWNGSGFIKLKFCRPRRLIIGRVDTSIGEVAYTPLASVLASVVGPYALTVGDELDITTEAGNAQSPALAAVVATVVGGAFPATPNSGYVGGESITIQVDDGAVVTITFSAADQTAAQVAAKINTVLGYAAASDAGGTVDLVGLIAGTSGDLTLADGSVGALAAIGLTAASTAGTGNVGNINSVTAAEIVALVNADAGLGAINAAAAVLGGAVNLFSETGGSGTIQMTATAMSAVLGLDVLAHTAAGHAGGLIPAGFRVRNAGGDEFVTMQTLTIPAASVGPWPVKVRPATDNGSWVGTVAAGAADVPFDQPSFAQVSVSNAVELGATLTEPQMDAAYDRVFDTSLSLTAATREATFSASARITPAVMRKGVENAKKASACGAFGRKFIGRAPLGFTISQASADVAQYREDRLFYTYPGWNVRVPEIAAVGAAGGEGFTDTGIITVGGDFPLATLDARLPPEDNPGQETGLISNFFEIEAVGKNFGIEEYTALKRLGICAPRVDRVGGSIYQSGITSDLTPGLTTQARRKMADFIQDSLAERMIPFSKKLATEARKDSIRAIVEGFLGELQSPQNPELARIADFSVDARSGNTPETEARGVFVLIIRVRTLASLDAIVLQTEIGEGVIVVTETA